VLDGQSEHACAGGGDLIVTARRTLLALGDGRCLPAGAEERRALEPSEDRIDGAARERGRVHDVEAVADAGGDGLEDGDGRRRERSGRGSHA
jgi:hypothetical protein